MEYFKKRKLPPETLLYTGESSQPTVFTHLKYNKESFSKFDDIQALSPDKVDWILVEGLKDAQKIQDLCSKYNVDSLVIEDILNVHQRNKIEMYDNYIFSVQEYAYLDEETIKYDYISNLLFEDKLITFSEHKNKFLYDILNRIEKDLGVIRKHKHQYLFYVIKDMIVDEKYAVYYLMEKEVNVIEEKLLNLKRNDEIELYNIRKQLLYLYNSSSQLYENLFINKNFEKVVQNKEIVKYYNDLKDHLVNLKERCQFELDVVNNLYEMHLNNLSHKMNSIMTTLTIFSAIFIPLSFVAGVFGMNFVNFPILQNENGMLIFILICISIPIIMLAYFKNRKWF